MASWKKIIVSGSDASLNTVTVSGCFVGNICGVASCATTITTTDTTATNTDYNVTFTDGAGSGKTIRVDTSKLVFNPSTNLLKVGTGISGCGGIVIGGVDGGASPITATVQYSPNGSGTGDVVLCLPESSGVLALTTDTVAAAGNANCLGGAPQACYVMMCGNQNVCGVKNFVSCVVASSGVAVTGTICASSNICSAGIIRGANICATASICGPMVCVSGRVTGADICATTSICGPMVCVSGTATANTVCSAGNVFIGGEILPINSCLIVRTTGTIRACIDSIGICTPGTVRAGQICSVGSVCGAGLNVSGDAIVGGNATVSGNLTVNGSLVYLNVTDLAVEDKFILLNSGSNVAREGGLIIDEGNPSGSGHAFIYDADTSRWGFTASLAGTATSVIPDAFAAAVVTSDLTEYQKAGNIRISGEDIFIYS